MTRIRWTTLLAWSFGPLCWLGLALWLLLS